MANEIDDLWAKIAEDPILPPADLDFLIAYYRKGREGGIKPKKDRGPTATLDPSILGLKPKPTTPTIFKGRRV